MDTRVEKLPLLGIDPIGAFSRQQNLQLFDIYREGTLILLAKWSWMVCEDLHTGFKESD